MLPVGLLKAFNPLGHSGHPRLHAVVGSIERANGLPQTIGFFKIRDNQKLLYSKTPFQTFRKDSILSICVDADSCFLFKQTKIDINRFTKLFSERNHFTLCCLTFVVSN